jgi:4'-phosphopantetheinyl transferase
VANRRTRGTIPRVPTANPSLDDLAGEVHVYLSWMDEATAPALLERYREILSAPERERQARFHFERHRHLYLVSHALVRTSLAHYVDAKASELTFVEGEFGRPEIAPAHDFPKLRFNLSHTEGLAACVVCLESDCGVDVEQMNRVKDLDGVARRVYTEPELADLRSLKGDLREGRFTDYWTLKEAYMKARGKGFQLPPHTFTVQLSRETPPTPQFSFAPGFDDDANDWQLALRSLHREIDGATANYRLAVAVRSGAFASREVVVRTVVPG